MSIHSNAYLRTIPIAPTGCLTSPTSHFVCLPSLPSASRHLVNITRYALYNHQGKLWANEGAAGAVFIGGSTWHGLVVPHGSNFFFSRSFFWFLVFFYVFFVISDNMLAKNTPSLGFHFWQLSTALTGIDQCRVPLQRVFAATPSWSLPSLNFLSPSPGQPLISGYATCASGMQRDTLVVVVVGRFACFFLFFFFFYIRQASREWH